MNDRTERVYLALGDSMSIDLYTEVLGGGAVAQLYRSLGHGWALDDRTCDGCVIEGIPRDGTGDLITLTIGGNNLLVHQGQYLSEGLDDFAMVHRDLLSDIRTRNPDAVFIVGTVYSPQYRLDPKREALLDEANEIIRRNTKQVGARLADIRERFRGHESELVHRLIEPNLEGATAIAELFSRAWREAAL
jgi:lysophospholipase L1-like esterase